MALVWTHGKIKESGLKMWHFGIQEMERDLEEGQQKGGETICPENGVGRYKTLEYGEIWRRPMSKDNLIGTETDSDVKIKNFYC